MTTRGGFADRTRGTCEITPLPRTPSDKIVCWHTHVFSSLSLSRYSATHTEVLALTEHRKDLSTKNMICRWSARACFVASFLSVTLCSSFRVRHTIGGPKSPARYSSSSTSGLPLMSSTVDVERRARVMEAARDSSEVRVDTFCVVLFTSFRRQMD